MRSLFLSCLFVILSAPCFAQYEIDDIRCLTDKTGAWQKLFYQEKDVEKMKELFPKFREYLNSIDIGSLSYRQINKLHDFVINYNKVTSSDEYIGALSKAYRLFTGIKEYMGDDSFRKVPTTSLDDHVDEVYRVLPAQFLRTVRLSKNSIDMATKKLLFKDGLAEYCIRRPDPGRWGNRNMVTSFKYAMQAEHMLVLYKSHHEESELEPSEWFNEIWADERYIAFKKGKSGKPGRVASTWDLDGTIETLEALRVNPTQRDLNILLGNMGSNWRGRGLGEIVIDMAGFMKSTELKVMLLEAVISVCQSFIEKNSEGKILICEADRKRIDEYLNVSKALLDKINSEKKAKNANIKQEFYDNGRMKTYEFYNSNGLLETRQFYYENGYKRRQENYNKETGLIRSTIERNEKGVITKEEFYDDEGKIVRFYSYWPNGKMYEKSVRDDQGKMGLLEIFHSNGKINQRIYDVEGDPDCKIKIEEYDIEGELLSTEYFNGSVVNKRTIHKQLELPKKNEVVSKKSPAEQNDFMAKMDLYLLNISERNLALNDADIDFIFGKYVEGGEQTEGALDILSYIFNNEHTSQEQKVEARNFALLLMTICYQDVNIANLKRQQSIYVLELSDKIGILASSPIELMEFMKNRMTSDDIQLMVIESYGRLIPAVSRYQIKK